MAVYTVVTLYLCKPDIGRFWRPKTGFDQRFYRAGLSKAIGLLGDRRGSGARLTGLQAPLVPFQRYRPPAYRRGSGGRWKLAYLCSVERCGALQTGEDRMSATYDHGYDDAAAMDRWYVVRRWDGAAVWETVNRSQAVALAGKLSEDTGEAFFVGAEEWV